MFSRARAAASAAYSAFTRPAADMGERGQRISFVFDALGDKPPSSFPATWWQQGLNPGSGGAMRIGVVYACVNVIAQEVARMDAAIWSFSGGREQRRPVRPEFQRLLDKPNKYQSSSDFWLMMMMNLLISGNAYCYAQRVNDQVVGWHPLPSGGVTPMAVEGTGEVLYRVAPWMMNPDEMWEYDAVVPGYDMLHLRLFCPSHPMIGMSPLWSNGPAIAQNQSIAANSASFFHNMSRPSGILTAPDTSTGKKITNEQAAEIKERFAAVTQRTSAGMPVVLASGYNWTPLTINAVDAQMVEQYKMSILDISRAFRVPPAMLNMLDGATYNNVENLQKMFVVQCLGFYLNHIEKALSSFIGLTKGEYVEFDQESAMTRPNVKERYDALKTAVQGGIITPNEARQAEHLPAVPGGDKLFLQQQMLPIDVGRDEKGAPVLPPPEPEDEPVDAAKMAGALRRRAAMIRTQSPARLGHTRALPPR